MVIGKIKLTGNLPSWYDSVNNIHLIKGRKEEREITDKHDFDSIQKGVDAGKIVFIPAKKQEEKPVEQQKKAKAKKAKKVEPKQEEVVHVDINVINEGDDKE